jgi:hypothetical protein
LVILILIRKFNIIISPLTPIENMKKNIVFLVPAFILFLTSCEKEDLDLYFDKVSGYVQKGPYLNGAAITISELAGNLTQTGRQFSSQIMDNKGTFELHDVKLSNRFVELRADGFYFNEVLNENSAAQLTLFALSDIKDKSTLNVNILSNLEKGRVEYLISNGISFQEAKKQAQSEILKIFEIEKPDMVASEALDITKSGENNAILLAISVILQGYQSVANLSELLANISTDIREDGVLNSQTLGNILINNAKVLKANEIRNNLIGRYETLGLNVTVPDFEKYINQFIEKTAFQFTNYILYPSGGKNGLNILDKIKIEYETGTYSMKAVLPAGTNVKVKIGGHNWSFPAFQENTGWEYSEMNDSDNSRIFSSTRTGEIDFSLRVENYGDTISVNQVKISVFENSDTKATWTKTISVLPAGSEKK